MNTEEKTPLRSEFPLAEGTRRSLARSLSSKEYVDIDMAIRVIDKEKERFQDQLQEEGLSQLTFSLGIFNLIATSWIIGRWPQYLWVFYGVKCFILIPTWWAKVIQRYNGGLWIFDFCWVANLLFGLYMAVSFFGAVTDERYQRSFFLCFYAIALGPLGWACLVLHNGLVLHSVERTASLFIHMTPTVVAWTIVTFPEEMAKTWPGRFPGAQALAEVELLDLYMHGFLAYVCWLALYATWLLSIGVNCDCGGPLGKYNTVFDDLYKKHNLADTFTKWTGTSNIRVHASLYLLLHCIACAMAFGWPLVCLRCNWAHLGFGLVLVGCSTWWGAGYYDYLLSRKYMKILRQLLEDSRSQKQ